MESWKDFGLMILNKIIDLIRSPEIVEFNTFLWENVKQFGYDTIIFLRELIDCFVN